MIVRRIQRALVAGAVVVSMGAAGSGIAHAAGTVLSDKVNWTGQAVINPDLTVDFHSTKCKLVSDGEPTVKCQVTGHGTIDQSTGVVTGTTVIESSDGTITDNFTLTQSPKGNGAFTTKGKCTEKDTPDPGQPPDPSYPCKEKGKGTNTANPDGTYTTNASMKILEKSTAP